MINEVLIPILAGLAQIVSTAVLVQFALGLLLAFNVLDLRNRFVEALWHALNAILDPLLNPIRKLMPDTGAIDFSPIVLLFLIRAVLILLAYVGNHAA